MRTKDAMKKKDLKNHKGRTSEERYCEVCCPRDEEGRPIIQGKAAEQKKVCRSQERVCSKCKEYVRVYYVLSWKTKLAMRPGGVTRLGDGVFYERALAGDLKGCKVG